MECYSDPEVQFKRAPFYSKLTIPLPTGHSTRWASSERTTSEDDRDGGRVEKGLLSQLIEALIQPPLCLVLVYYSGMKTPTCGLTQTNPQTQTTRLSSQHPTPDFPGWIFMEPTTGSFFVTLGESGRICFKTTPYFHDALGKISEGF